MLRKIFAFTGESMWTPLPDDIKLLLSANASKKNWCLEVGCGCIELYDCYPPIIQLAKSLLSNWKLAHILQYGTQIQTMTCLFTYHLCGNIEQAAGTIKHKLKYGNNSATYI